MTPLELLCKDYHGIFRWFWDFPKFNFRLVLKPRWFLFCSFEDSLFPLSHPVTVFTQESKRMKSGMKGQKNITWLSMKFQSDHEYYSKFPKIFQPWRPLKIRTQEGKGWKKNQETVSGFVKTFFVQITFRNNNLKCLRRIFKLNSVGNQIKIKDNNGLELKSYRNYMNKKLIIN